MTWVQAIEKSKLTSEKPNLFQHQSKKIAVYQQEGEVFAFDNRCPHEGYPLREGSIDGKCVLTCNWHNWKFDLRSGQNLMGEDHLRTYPTKFDGDYLWIDVSDPDPEVLLEKNMKALKSAYEDQRYDRIARVLARFHYDKLDPLKAISQVIHWAHDRFEWGMTHAFGTAAEWLQLYQNEEELELQMVALTEIVDHIGFDSLRYPSFPFTDDVNTFDEQAFLDAIEAENEQVAVALIRGALQEGKTMTDLDPVLTKATLAHFRDFGHSLIYLTKIHTIVSILGDDVAEPLLKSFVRQLCYSSREDLLPEFKAYHPSLEKSQSIGLREEPSEQGLASPFGLSVKAAEQWVLGAMETHMPIQIYAGLLTAVAENFLYFDTEYKDRYDIPVSKNFGWLGITHGLTFTNAVRTQCERNPDMWREGLLQIACFVGRATPYLNKSYEVSIPSDDDLNGQMAEIPNQIYDHGFRHPIFSCHLLKTWKAAEEELAIGFSAETQRLLKAGLLRFLHGSIKQKHTRRTIRQSLSLVSKDYA